MSQQSGLLGRGPASKGDHKRIRLWSPLPNQLIGLRPPPAHLTRRYSMMMAVIPLRATLPQERINVVALKLVLLQPRAPDREAPCRDRTHTRGMCSAVSTI